ncbi:uncharacterized protein LOC126974955 isoform X2 [Leptidea sinapis]|nr:uncharacterized protein LOC126974955 isoform X2 [Leptidea sinapis]
MGLWHSTPLARRHKSKISLTWVLKENLEKNIDKEKVLQDKNFERKVRDRVLSRSEFYQNNRFKSACDEFNGADSFSDTSDETEYIRKKHRHRHKRKKKHPRFGYDITDLDSFLSEATLEQPGNIPVVIAFPTTLYQTQKELQCELSLPLGTVVNAVFKNQQWLYAQTPHGDEGYVQYTACLPLGILPTRSSLQKKMPCWESSTDIYPRPCGNLTDTEKDLRDRTRSECTYKRTKRYKTSCAEKEFDNLYLKTKSVSNISAYDKENATNFSRTMIIVNSDYVGSTLNKTLTVFKGDVVVMLEGVRESDVDSEWYYVRKIDGSEGFIPASITARGFN